MLWTLEGRRSSSGPRKVCQASLLLKEIIRVVILNDSNLFSDVTTEFHRIAWDVTGKGKKKHKISKVGHLWSDIVRVCTVCLWVGWEVEGGIAIGYKSKRKTAKWVIDSTWLAGPARPIYCCKSLTFYKQRTKKNLEVGEYLSKGLLMLSFFFCDIRLLFPFVVRQFSLPIDITGNVNYSLWMYRPSPFFTGWHLSHPLFIATFPYAFIVLFYDLITGVSKVKLSAFIFKRIWKPSLYLPAMVIIAHSHLS